MSSPDESHTWFIPGYAISRQIIVSQIRFYLGQYATVRPFTYRGREGYLVTAPGQGLTMVCRCCRHSMQKNVRRADSRPFSLSQPQIEDLKNLSRQYEEQAASKMVGRPLINAPVEFSTSGDGHSNGSGSGSGGGSSSSSSARRYSSHPSRDSYDRVSRRR